MIADEIRSVLEMWKRDIAATGRVTDSRYTAGVAVLEAAADSVETIELTQRRDLIEEDETGTVVDMCRVRAERSIDEFVRSKGLTPAPRDPGGAA